MSLGAAGKSTDKFGRELGPLPAFNLHSRPLFVFVILHQISAKLQYAYQHPQLLDFRRGHAGLAR